VSQQLEARGFHHDLTQNAPLCTLWLNDLRVDFMPDDPSILGFSNDGYSVALREAMTYPLSTGTHPQLAIKRVKPEHFLATKLAAYAGRGGNDPMASPDVEDIMTRLEGRASLMTERLNAAPNVRQYVGQHFAALMQNQGFEYAVQSATQGDTSRATAILDKIELAIHFGEQALKCNWHLLTRNFQYSSANRESCMSYSTHLFRKTLRWIADAKAPPMAALHVYRHG
jgi:hypothetical protein